MPIKHTEATKQKIRASMLGKNVGKLIGDANPAKRPEVRRKLKEATLRDTHIAPSFAGRRHSELSKLKNSEAHRGSNNKNWRGGTTSYTKEVKNSREFKEWRHKVYLRDGWICQKHQEKDCRNLNAHHIQNFSQYADLRFSVENGITLCEKAHKEFHRQFSRRNNTREQLAIYLQQ